MNYENYFKDLFETVPDYIKIVLIVFLIKNYSDLLKEGGFLKKDLNRSNLDFKHILMEENEEYLDYNKNEEEAVIEQFLDK